MDTSLLLFDVKIVYLSVRVCIILLPRLAWNPNDPASSMQQTADCVVCWVIPRWKQQSASLM